METIIRNKAEIGEIFNVSPNGRGISLYNGTGTAIVVGEVVLIAYEETDGYEMQAIEAITVTFPVRTAVALEAIADGDIGYFQIEGECLALVDGTANVTDGDSLELVSGDIAFTYEASARAQNGAAVAKETYTDSSDALKKVFLFSEQHKMA